MPAQEHIVHEMLTSAAIMVPVQTRTTPNAFVQIPGRRSEQGIGHLQHLTHHTYYCVASSLDHLKGNVSHAFDIALQGHDHESS